MLKIIFFDLSQIMGVTPCHAQKKQIGPTNPNISMVERLDRSSSLSK